MKKKADLDKTTSQLYLSESRRSRPRICGCHSLLRHVPLKMCFKDVMLVYMYRNMHGNERTVLLLDATM